MSRLYQQAGPDQIWIQPMDAENSGLSEPLAFTESDDWYASLFNSYFLGIFKKESEGFADENSVGFIALKQHLTDFFTSGSMADLHRYLCSRWFQEGGSDFSAGTWFSVSWNDFSMDDFSGPAIGFFFSTEDEVFLQLGGGEARISSGLPLKKPAFACLIFQQADAAFRMLQHQAKPGFWSKELFPFTAASDDAFHSKEFFRLCKSFSEDILLKEPEKTREDQLGFLADSLAYTRQNQEVSFEKFREEVLKEPSLMDAFDQYKDDYSDRKQWNPPDKFAVSAQVQNQAGKYIRSVIKLDKNFHIYVHGAKERIEKGFDDEKKLNYYTLWFDAEA